ncbi:MAG: hypothetical protein MZW92_12645 [Comamonadaceae bacterium]|nr:hypothetical protein [Comamonadaceae bacterium]
MDARPDRRGPGDGVHRRRQAPLGASSPSRGETGVEVRVGDPAENVPGQGRSSSPSGSSRCGADRLRPRHACASRYIKQRRSRTHPGGVRPTPTSRSSPPTSNAPAAAVRQRRSLGPRRSHGRTDDDRRRIARRSQTRRDAPRRADRRAARRPASGSSREQVVDPIVDLAQHPHVALHRALACCCAWASTRRRCSGGRRRVRSTRGLLGQGRRARRPAGSREDRAVDVAHRRPRDSRRRRRAGTASRAAVGGGDDDDTPARPQREARHRGASSRTSSATTRAARAGPGATSRRCRDQRLHQFIYRETVRAARASRSRCLRRKYFDDIDPQPDCVVTTEIASRPLRGRHPPHAHGRLARRRPHHGHPHRRARATSTACSRARPRASAASPITRKQIRATPQGAAT